MKEGKNCNNSNGLWENVIIQRKYKILNGKSDVFSSFYGVYTKDHQQIRLINITFLDKKLSKIISHMFNLDSLVNVSNRFIDAAKSYNCWMEREKIFFLIFPFNLSVSMQILTREFDQQFFVFANNF